MVSKLNPVFDSISFSHAGKTVSLIKSEDVTKSGTHYYDFKYELGNSLSIIRIWSNELIRFVRLLDRLLETGFDEVDWKIDGIYPLDLDLSSNGGLGVFVYVHNGKTALVFRRLNTSFRGKEGKTAFSKYLNWNRAGKWVAQTKIPVDENCRELITALVEQLQEVLSSVLSSVAEDLSVQFAPSSISDLVKFSERLTLAGRHAGVHRTMAFDIGLPDFSNFRIGCCSVSLLETVLSNCAGAATPNNISRLVDFAIDEEAIKRLLSWNIRYFEETLQAGFVAAPYFTKEVGETIVAFRDKTIFAADPLLMSLIPFEIEEAFDKLDDDDIWISVAQFSSSPFDQALSRGIASGPFSCGLGKVVYPKTKRKSIAIKELAKPTTSLKRNRWRILQIMNLHSCQLANISYSIKFRFDDRLVLQSQRLALLINDVSELFDDSIEMVEELIEDAKQVYLDTVTTCSEPTQMLQPSELPKMPKEVP